MDSQRIKPEIMKNHSSPGNFDTKPNAKRNNVCTEQISHESSKDLSKLVKNLENRVASIDRLAILNRDMIEQNLTSMSRQLAVQNKNYQTTNNALLCEINDLKQQIANNRVTMQYDEQKYEEVIKTLQSSISIHKKLLFGGVLLFGVMLLNTIGSS